MTCKKCKIKMVELKRTYHKKRKWVCPRCGAVRFQQVVKKKRNNV